MANELSKKEVSGVISPQTGTVEDTYEIPDKPGYDEMICKLQPSDPAHADLFNTILGRIISNVAFLKRNSVSHEELGIPEGVSPSVENQVPAIPESPVKRENLADGDNMGTILAKVRKWLGDLKSVAFSGSYKDLSDKPSIPTVPGAIKNPHPLSVNGKSYDGEVAVEVGTIGIAYGGTGATTAAAARTALGLGAASTQGIANNLTTTAAGYALDARQGKVLQDEVNQINSNLYQLNTGLAELDDKIGSIKFHLGTLQIKEDTIQSNVTYSLPEGYLHALIIFTTANNFYSMAFISSNGVKTANLIIFNHTSGLYETCSCSINNSSAITLTLANKSDYQKTYGNMVYIYSFK